MKFSLDCCRHFNLMRTKYTKQKRSKASKMLAARNWCTSVRLFTIQRFTSIIVVIQMLFDILLALRLFYAHRIHCNQGIRYPKIMARFSQNKCFQIDKETYSHDIGSTVHVLRAKKIGRLLINSTTKLD